MHLWQLWEIARCILPGVRWQCLATQLTGQQSDAGLCCSDCDRISPGSFPSQMSQGV